MAVNKEEEKKEKMRYTKQKILSSKQFANRRDLLSVILKDDMEYTEEQVKKELETFMKGKVK